MLAGAYYATVQECVWTSLKEEYLGKVSILDQSMKM